MEIGSTTNGFKRGRGTSQDENYLFPSSKRISRSPSAAAPMVTPSALPQPTTPIQPEINSVNRTFRLSEIPLSIDEDQLEKYLNGLPHGNYKSDGPENVLSLSLAPHKEWLVATVTFHHEPYVFAKCQPNHNVKLNLSRQLGRAKIEVDCDFIGITPLYHHEDAEVDIVAISGLSSHPFGSWRSRRYPDVMWLRDILPQDLNRSRVFIWGYDSNLRDGITTHSVEDFAITLLKDIQSTRKKIEGVRKTHHAPLFSWRIALVVLLSSKPLLTQHWATQSIFRSILQACIGLLFFGVPNRGLNSINLESLVKNQKNARFVADLREGSQFLKALHRNLACIWERNLKHCIVASFFENTDTNTVEAKEGKWSRTGTPIRMVTEDSATEAVPGEEVHRRICISSDHSNMVKYYGRSDPSYSLMVGELQDVFKEKDKIICERIKLATSHINFRHELLQSISPLEPLKRHQDIQSKRANNTGTWLLSHTRYQNWCNINMQNPSSTNRVLCCYGMPGAGKTFICSTVVDYLLSRSSEPTAEDQLSGVACIYCDYRDQDKQTLTNILGSLLQQYLSILPQPPGEVIKTLDKIQKENKKIDTPYAISMLNNTVKHFSCAFVCIDALDELKQEIRSALLDTLRTELSVNVRVFLTGRPHIKEDVSRRLRITKPEAIEIVASLSDIQGYLNHRIEQDDNPDTMNDQLKKEIIISITERSKGMFLLPALHIHMVLEQPTKATRRKALKALPDRLEDAFSETIERIQKLPGSHAELAMKTLLWIHLARRPLHFRELGHALAVETDRSELDEDAIPTKTMVLKCCFGLVIVDEETSTVRFTHYTLEEYFRRESNRYFPSAIASVAETCLTYLNFDELSHQCKSFQELNQLKSRFVFLEYAACYWGQYVRQQFNETIATLTLKLLKTTSGQNCAIQVLYYHIDEESEPFWQQQNFPHSMLFSHIHAAAYFGLHEVLRVILTDEGYDRRDEYDMTPLSLAAEQGHAAVVQLLVERNDVDVDFKNDYGMTALLLAAREGHEEVVRLLVERDDVKTDTKDNGGMTPLSWAAMYGREAVVRLLAERNDVEANSKDHDGRTPLSYAVTCGNEAVVRLLVEREDVEADSKNKNGRTPLSWAAERGHEAVVRLLAECQDVEADSKDDNGRTPLSWAAERGHGAVVRLLAERQDVEADSKDDNGRTPLSWAGCNNYSEHRYEIVRLLVERDDVKADSKDKNGRTPLSWAAMNGHEAVVRLLAERDDVNVNFEDNNGQTPLVWAASQYWTSENAPENALEVVVRLHVDLDRRDDDAYSKYSCMHYVQLLDRRYEAILRLLVKHGDVETNSKNRYGQRALLWAAKKGSEAVVWLLTQREDVDIECWLDVAVMNHNLWT